MVQVDGTPGRSPHGAAGVGVVIRTLRGRVLVWRSVRVKAQTCNEAEYQAVIVGLELMQQRYPGTGVRCLSDSQVVVQQMTGQAAVRAAALRPLHARATALVAQIGQVEFVAISRRLNRLADSLAWEAVAGRSQVRHASQSPCT